MRKVAVEGVMVNGKSEREKRQAEEERVQSFLSFWKIQSFKKSARVSSTATPRTLQTWNQMINIKVGLET